MQEQPTKLQVCCLGNKRGKVLEKEIKDDPRSKRTRRLLQDAFTDLMSTKKFNKISVQDITARAEVNRATFYAHFDDKYELLNSQIRDSFQNLLDEKLPAHPTFTIANLRILALTMHEYLAAFAGHCAVAAADGDNRLIVQQVERQTQTVVLEWLKNTPDYAPPQSKEVAALVVSWAIFGTVLEVAWQGRKISAEQLTTQVLSLLEPGLRVYLVNDSASAK